MSHASDKTSRTGPFLIYQGNPDPTPRRSIHLSVIDGDGAKISPKISPKSSTSSKHPLLNLPNHTAVTTSKSEPADAVQWDAKKVIKVMVGLALLPFFLYF